MPDGQRERSKGTGHRGLLAAIRAARMAQDAADARSAGVGGDEADSTP